MEFTGWVCPIANRLHDGARLYTDGSHLNLAPLPFLVMRLLFPHGAVWIDESLLNFLCQAGTLAILYWQFSRHLSVGMAFLGVLAATSVFFALTKTVLYDSMAQLLVAAAAAAVSHKVRRPLAAVSPAPDWPRLALVGLVLGLLLLAKQNTGIGAALGVGAVLWFIPPGQSLSIRSKNIFALIGFTGLTIVGVTIAFSPLMDFGGMIQDVFIHGSEPKGGLGHLLRLIFEFSGCFILMAAGWLAIFALIAAVRRRGAGWKERFISFLDRFMNFPTAPAAGAPWLPTGIIAAAAGLLVTVPAMAPLVGATNVLLLYFGGATVVVMVAGVLVGKNDLTGHPLASYALVFLPAAIFHNLSVSRFRWTFDNNPLIVLACVFLLAPLVTGRPEKHGRFAWLRCGALGAFLFSSWAGFAGQLGVANRCTESWPEIHHLAGARLRPESGGMRKLVATVRAAAGPEDTVLLLPEDPNVAAWFDRPRPPLSSEIIFCDQYLDRYVDKDFATIQAHPPKVIVVGPVYFWRYFSHQWRVDRGAERLIDLIGDRLLPAQYTLISEQKISFIGMTETMQVYRLNDQR